MKGGMEVGQAFQPDMNEIRFRVRLESLTYIDTPGSSIVPA